MKNIKAFSLIETLVVISIFAGLAIVTTQAIIVTLTNARKAESSVQTRESLQYVISVMERSLRSSQNINSAGAGNISYINQDGQNALISCVNAAPTSSDGYILLNSNRISSDDITITDCNFSSVPGTGSVPDMVSISISGKAKNLSGAEQTPITVAAIVYLRVY